MKLRWVIDERKYEAWDSRFDCWNTHTLQSTPRLQYCTDDVNWIDVPTIVLQEAAPKPEE